MSLRRAPLQTAPKGKLGVSAEHGVSTEPTRLARDNTVTSSIDLTTIALRIPAMRNRVLSSTQVMLTLQSLARRLFLPPRILSWHMTR
jgi:hypothetical protein